MLPRMDETTCPSLAIRKISVQVTVYPVALVSRPAPTGCNNSGYQTLIFSNDKDVLFGSNSRSCIFELLGDGNDSSASGQFRLAAQPLELQERGDDGELKPYSCQVALHRAVYDSYSKAVYFVEGRALMQLGPDNIVSPLAGHRELCGNTDGPGPAARFQLPQTLVSDGAGNLYVGDGGAIRRVALPSGGLQSLPVTIGAAPQPLPTPQSHPQQQRQHPQPTSQHPPPRHEAMVTTVYGGPGSFVDVAYDNSNRRLYGATLHAVYLIPEDGRVPARIAGYERALTTTSAFNGSSASTVNSQNSGAVAAPLAAAAAVGWSSYPAAASVVVHGGGCEGGSGFTCITGLVSAPDGGLLMVDRHQVFRLGETGGGLSGGFNGAGPKAVICLGKNDTSWGGAGYYPVLLHNGWLALCQYHHRRVLLLHLGLSCGGGGGGLPYARLPWQWHHEGVGGLLADLASLLASPDGTDDIEVAVGGRGFRCHRLILSARCLYFRRLFAGGFADSGSRRVVLQDADPEAFDLLLRYMYTGDMTFPPQLLRPVAELADRLLLTQVAVHVHRRLLAAAEPATVMADMLWAHQQGFEELLAGLKDWYLRHQPEVLAAAGDSVRQLMVAAPSIMYDLHCATVRQADRRR